MSKHSKRSKVIRSYEIAEREESTAGLMALRIIIILVIILFICATAVLFAYDFQKETQELNISTSDTETDEFYRQFDEEENKILIDYCNNSVSISEYYTVELSNYTEEIQVNSLMLDSLNKMVEAAEKDGIYLEVVRGYMSFDECKSEHNSLILSFEEMGCTLAESESQVREIFPDGGNNEYQTGLLIKLSDMDSEAFSKTDAYNWLYKNGVNYGFINRYTDEKKVHTGINEDLTVYRFVGAENAKKMRSFGMCLEEYNDYCSYR